MINLRLVAYAAVAFGITVAAHASGPATQPTPYSAWQACVIEAVDALYAQTDPAQMIASVAFTICSNEEEVWRADRKMAWASPTWASADVNEFLDFNKRLMLQEQVMPRILVNRAAKAKSPAETNRPPIYRPM